MTHTTGNSPQADVGLIGLAVMGQNLVLNIADHGFNVAVYNRTASVTDEFLAEHPAGSFGQAGGGLIGHHDLAAFVRSIKRPRRIVMMIKAGGATDAVIDALAELVEAGDVLVDGGNAHWEDTNRREAALAGRGILFVGSGVSGGEVGARFGPSLMPGGDAAAWELIKPIWTSIAAKVDSQTGEPLEDAKAGSPVYAPNAESCAAHIGPAGAGHFVKMVHNGIEYADMQIICEAYHVLRDIVHLSPKEMSEIFAQWNEGALDSYLIQITADILAQDDPRSGEPFVDVVLDTAGQKGTGKWTGIVSLDMGVPAPTIAEAVFARSMSSFKSLRMEASKRLVGTTNAFEGDPSSFIEAVGRALHCSKICAYAQGFAIMEAASKEYKWNLDFGSIAMIWRGGCIIRARLLQQIKDAYDRDPNLPNLLMDEKFAASLAKQQGGWRAVVGAGVRVGVPVPAINSALAYYDALRSERLPASLLQSQRDYFGAHTYERVDRPRGEFYHLDWSGDRSESRE